MGKNAQAISEQDEVRDAERVARRALHGPLTITGLMIIVLHFLSMFLIGLVGFPLFFPLSACGLLTVVPIAAVSLFTTFSRHGQRMGNRRRLRILGLMIFMALAVIWGLPRGGFLAADLGLRHRVASKVSISELQSWAAGLVRIEAARLEKGKVSTLLIPGKSDYIELVPKSVQNLDPSGIVVCVRPDMRSVTVEFGGGFYHYGVRICEPQAVRSWSLDEFRWRPGVYGYHD